MIDLTHDDRIRGDAEALETRWATDPRWGGIERPYAAADVVRLRGSFTVEHTIARLGAERLWELMHRRGYVRALGAMTGGQAVEMVKAGLEAIYLSGWQVAADANLAGHTYPDQSLYPANSVPAMVRRINNALQRADQIAWADGPSDTHWIAPIVADAEAGFGGPLNAFELMKAMIEAGAAAVHYEDQLASEKKCGHLGGKVLVPTEQFIRTLTAARLAADVLDVPAVLVARTDADAATLLTSDVDQRDRPFVTGERTAEGYFRVTNGARAAIARGLSYGRRTPTCCGARPRTRTWTRRGRSPRRSTRSSPASCSRTTARRRSTGGGTWTTRRSRGSRTSSARWATGSSSSRSRASTR